MGNGFVYSDGGRSAAGFKGMTGDCVCRSIAIATGKPYKEVYDDINSLAKNERKKRKSSARTGVRKDLVKNYLASLGWKWIPTMGIGQGCRVHLVAGELPDGVIIARVSKHLTVMIDGVIHDTHDQRRTTVYVENGVKRISGRCVYGYFIKDITPG